MKLKGLTKLALSGVALAAVAATLGTSTYAWYVSNSTATVNGITGGTNTDPAGSLLLNALEYDSGTGAITAASSWTNTLNFSAINAGLKVATPLIPVTKDVTGYTPTSNATGWHDKGLNPKADEDAYGYLMFGAQQSDTSKNLITMSFGIANTTTANPQQTAYYAVAGTTPGPVVDGTATSVNAGTPFTEDFVYSLKFDVYKLALAGANKSTVLTASDASAGATLAADSFYASDLSNPYACKAGMYSNGNAHAYYKALSTDDRVENQDGSYGAILGGESVTENTVSSIALNLSGGTPYLIVIRYWLDGADQHCFDSTINQTFELKLKMVATAPAEGQQYYM